LQDDGPQGDQKKPESDDDEEESKTASVKDRNTSASQKSQTSGSVPSAKPKKISNGDFLSMYLSEREGKKKKKKKKKDSSAE
jgi:hypothetical protein